VPRRVQGVARAVTVAAARDHAVVLVGNQTVATSPAKTRSLQHLCEDAVAGHMTSFNAVHVLFYAETLGTLRLLEAAQDFIRINADGVLAYTDVAELDHLLLCPDTDIDLAARKPLQLLKKVVEQRPSSMSHAKDDRKINPPPRMTPTAKKVSVAEQISRYIDFTDAKTLSSNWIVLTKELRSVRKKLTQIAVLELAMERPGDVKVLTPEQEDKMRRKDMLEQDVKLLTVSLERIERGMLAFKIAIPQSKSAQLATSKEETPRGPTSLVEENAADGPQTIYHCKHCNIKCPNHDSFTLHLSGRKHRNRMQQLERQKQEETLEQIQATRRRQNLHRQLSLDGATDAPPVLVKKTLISKMSFQQILEEEAQRQRQKGAARDAPVQQGAPHKQSTPAAAHQNTPRKPNIPTTGSGTLGGTSVSLLDFLSPAKMLQPKRKEAASASSPAWTVPISSPANRVEDPPPARAVPCRLADIQQQEEEKAPPPTTDVESHWFVERQKQALSMGEIQKEEEEEEAMARMVEEQLVIEKQIQKEREAKARPDRRRKGEHREMGRGKGGRRGGRGRYAKQLTQGRGGIPKKVGGKGRADAPGWSHDPKEGLQSSDAAPVMSAMGGRGRKDDEPRRSTTGRGRGGCRKSGGGRGSCRTRPK